MYVAVLFATVTGALTVWALAAAVAALHVVPLLLDVS
jgi:hypothetical protein